MRVLLAGASKQRAGASMNCVPRRESSRTASQHPTFATLLPPQQEQTLQAVYLHARPTLRGPEPSTGWSPECGLNQFQGPPLGATNNHRKGLK